MVVCVCIYVKAQIVSFAMETCKHNSASRG